jgi:hypothetical protein
MLHLLLFAVNYATPLLETDVEKYVWNKKQKEVQYSKYINNSTFFTVLILKDSTMNK